MNAADIEWGEPPRSLRHRGEVAAFVAALTQRPTEWAKYPTPVNDASLGSKNQRRYPGTEWVVRKRPGGGHDMYARWIGEQVAS